MKRKTRTLADHEAMGALARDLNDRVIALRVLVGGSFPLTAPQQRAAEKAVRAISKLRSVLDDALFADVDGDDATLLKVYYGRGEAR